MDTRGSFGKFLFAKVSGDYEDSRVLVHLSVMAYYATSSAFDESELDIVVDYLRVKSRDFQAIVEHVPELQVERMRSQPPSLVSLADDIADKTLSKTAESSSMIQCMGTLIKVSKIYHEHGCVGKHLHINDEICRIGSRLRELQVR
jgi:hypothetical protein